MQNRSISRRIAEFTTQTQACDIPTTARNIMRLSLLDWASVGIAGASEPVAQITRDMVLSEAGEGQSTLIGCQTRVPARAAALANGATSHALDYDDTHFAHIGHPSVAVIPAALALAQKLNVDGAEFLDAALIGVETSIRVGVWLGRSHYQTGFHQTGTAGAFGAAMASARLLGLDTDQAMHVLGLCATRASGLKSQFGTMGKPYNAGLAAANGVEAATLVAAGFRSSPNSLEGEQGFGPTHAGEAIASALDGLGKEYTFETVQHKFHACCHGLHAMIESLLALKAQNLIATEAIRSVTISTHPRWLRVCNIAVPETGLEAKFSYRLTAAMALCGTDTSALQSYSDETCQTPELTRVRDITSVLPVETIPETAAHVQVALNDGTLLSQSFDLNAPLAEQTRRAKLRAKAKSLLGEDREQLLWQAVSDENGVSLDALAALLSA